MCLSAGVLEIAWGKSKPLISLILNFTRRKRRQNEQLITVRSLALAELSLTIAVLYRISGPKFELFETDESDVIQAHDFMIPLPKISTKGIRVLIP